MRMSDREFKEEIFRRRNIYLQRRRERRKQIAIVSLLLCICLGIGIPQIVKPQTKTPVVEDQYSLSENDLEGGVSEVKDAADAAMQSESVLDSEDEAAEMPGLDAVPYSIAVSASEEQPELARYYTETEKIDAVMLLLTTGADVYFYKLDMPVRGTEDGSVQDDTQSDDFSAGTASANTSSASTSAGAGHALTVTLTDESGTRYYYRFLDATAEELEEILLKYESDREGE